MQIKLQSLFFSVLLMIFLVSCSTVRENITKNKKFPVNQTIVILPFENLTQTPYAGLKASYITEGVLRSKGIKVVRGYKVKDEKILLKNFKEYAYFLKGKVIEWRYKTGIDGEPAVSLYLEIEDKNKNIVWSAAGSKSQWGHKSVSLTAQELLNEIFEINKKPKSKTKNVSAFK